MPDIYMMPTARLQEERRKKERDLRRALASLEALRNQIPLMGMPPASTSKAERKVSRIREALHQIDVALEINLQLQEADDGI